VFDVARPPVVLAAHALSKTYRMAHELNMARAALERFDDRKQEETEQFEVLGRALCVHPRFRRLAWKSSA